jgi:hypothetical protein
MFLIKFFFSSARIGVEVPCICDKKHGATKIIVLHPTNNSKISLNQTRETVVIKMRWFGCCLSHNLGNSLIVLPL